MTRNRNQTKRAAIYARISDAREDDTAGVDRQREDCILMAQRRGYEVVAEFTDNNVSALKYPLAKRPNGARLLAAIEAGEIDVVLAYSAERLYRRVAEIDQLVEQLSGVPVETVASGVVDLSTADGKAQARMGSVFAQHESEKRGERVARAAAQRAQQGRYAGGRRRLGYTATASELVPHEAEEIRWAYQHVAEGGTLEAVVRRWRETLGKGSRGGQITGVQVRDILLRPMNAGIAVYQGAEIGTTNLPTIIDQETWRTVRAILMDPSRRTTVGRPATSLLAPVLQCGVCGGRVSAHSRIHRSNSKAVKGSPKDPIYRCREGHVSRHRTKLDDAVSGLVVGWLEKYGDRLVRPVTASKSAAKAVTEAETYRRKLEQLALLLANGDLEPADYASATRELRTRLATVEERIVTTAGKPQAAAIVRAGDIAGAWEAADDDTRRAVVKEIIERITLVHAKPGPFTMHGVDILWKD